VRAYSSALEITRIPPDERLDKASASTTTANPTLVCALHLVTAATVTSFRSTQRAFFSLSENQLDFKMRCSDRYPEKWPVAETAC
jgi:hypothetical protein